MRVIVSLALMGLAASAVAQDEQALAKASQNPVANLISVPAENNTYFDAGPSENIINGLFVKPVYPTGLTENWNLINRAIVPVLYVEGQDRIVAPDDQTDIGGSEVFPGFDDEFGLGNIQYQGFISPAAPGKVIWGLGPVVELPTNTDDVLGTDKWSAGPSLVVLTMPGKWVVGALAQNIWDFAGDSDAKDVNKFTFQPIINYNIGDGWYLTSTPIISANWENSGTDKWTIPVGGGVGRLMKFGNQPIDFKGAFYINAAKPEFGADWQLQFTVKWLFPKSKPPQ